MSRKKRRKIQNRDIIGTKYFKHISNILEKLHSAGCQRDTAHNRILHMDQYVALLLLYMFNPICTSLRALQEASELKKVQRKLGVPRASLGSLSEAARVFDSELLLEIIQELSAELKPVCHDKRLDNLGEILTLVDGTWLKALPKMAWALWQDEKHRAVKAHVHYEVLKAVPVAATVTDARQDERDVLEQNLKPGRLYVLDRGFVKFSLMQRIIDISSSFIARINDDCVFEIVEECELSRDALDAGVVRDAIVNLGSRKKREDFKQPLRIVEVECTPHIKNGKTGRGGPEQGDTILIATNRLDLPADVVALIFKHRWQVEIFFRSFKHILGCRHLISECQNGIELEVYAAIIACMLIALWTGRKPTLSTYRMMNWYFMGWADDEELLNHVNRLKKQDAVKNNS